MVAPGVRFQVTKCESRNNVCTLIFFLDTPLFFLKTLFYVLDTLFYVLDTLIDAFRTEAGRREGGWGSMGRRARASGSRGAPVLPQDCLTCARLTVVYVP